MSREPVAVVGGGIMGAGIAQVLARKGCGVRVHEINEELAEHARERIISRNYVLEDAVEEAISLRTRKTRCWIGCRSRQISRKRPTAPSSSSRP